MLLLLVYSAVLTYTSLHYHSLAFAETGEFRDLCESPYSTAGSHAPENCPLTHGARNLTGLAAGTFIAYLPQTPVSESVLFSDPAPWLPHVIYNFGLRAPPLS